jgi:pyruvate/2-oxoglutarate dehydrogenase complex dihydrolipoamide dehydrogenase (E3) component
MEDVDLIVIGSGQGGLPLAADFAKAGKHVVLFERGLIGGTCVNVGCTPSKAFLASAHTAGRARRGGPLGIAATIDVDVRAVMTRVRSVRDEWHSGAEQRIAGAGVDLVRATGSFTGARTVAGGGREVRAPLVVIDTGMSPAVPTIDGIAATPYLTNNTWFDQETLPKRLIVIGGGYIGLELGQGAQRLGTSVTIVQTSPHVMPNEEADATEVIRASLASDGVSFELGAKTTKVTHDGTLFRVTLDGTRTLEAEGLLVAAGRSPNTADLKLENSGIGTGKHGIVEVDEYLQTACPGVYALGDVAGQPAFTHVSWEDYRRLTSTFAGKPRRRDDRVLSYSTFTEPQLARTGLNEEQARAKGIDVRVETLQLSEVARGIEWNLEAGFYRMVVERATGKILGATMVGYEAGEIIPTIGFGIALGATWRDLDDYVGIHPTFGEGPPSLARLFESPA